MRYIWNMAADYRASAGPVTRFLMPPIAHYIRLWDSTSAARVDSFVANSRTVSERIHKYYRRDARVIYPPVDVEAFERVRDEEVEDYYLMAGELVAYKRPDLAVEAFNRLGRKLVVIGGGEMLDKIRHLAGPSVRVLGPQPFAVLKHHYARARALIFPGEEDFGLVPVESMASGRPVIAYGRGGATETVRTGISGLFFHEQTQAAVSSAVEEFEAAHFNSDLIVEQARLFGPQRFVAEMQGHINVLLGAGR
jgi:glycosyltransferase involved in cell wall biosynthesis